MNPAEFITEFKALDVSEGQQTHMLQLIEPLVVYSGTLDKIITVPEGFTFDGESIPDCLHGIVPPFGQSKRGACVHDYLYRFHGYADTEGQFHPVNRSQADAVYKELVLAKGLPSWRAHIRWSVLRIVGWIAWNTGGKSRP